MIQTYRRLKSHILLLFFVLWACSQSTPISPVKAQEVTGELDIAVENIFNRLTPDERVGQLFMVSFQGTNLTPNSPIARLIQEYRVGGVVISARNENFRNDNDTPARVLGLTNTLQMLAREAPVRSTASITAATLTATTTLTAPIESYTPLPLFVAVEHGGDGFPNTQIRRGLTNIPSQMALGATWEPEYARLVGQVVGRELSLLGINMLFGPSLDVLDNPRPDRSGASLGVYTFGGHPFWVQKMGEAYIRGVHQGSNHQVLTVATHFPGFGSSDREIDQVVPIVLKSLDQLRRTELPPFFGVTRLNPDNPDDIAGVTDGLMTAHIRYQGLQGNVPISLDPRNLPVLLALKEIVPWREQFGGLVVSASLGAPAALEGITTGRDVFPARRLAQDAFLAGSDILRVSDFAFEAGPEAELANIVDAILFFREKYASDPNFQIAVDRAVRRILKAKIRVYGPDLLNTEARRPVSNLDLLGDLKLDLSQIAQAGATLITPITQEGLNPLPDPPQPDENILIFTDSRLAQDCLDCPEFAVIETAALQEIILQLFGPQATGQISPDQISSYSFAELKAALTAETSTAETGEVEAQLEQADWVILAMLNINTETQPTSDAVRVLLRNRYDTLRNKNLVLFAFNAPYFLDETEVSQLTAYYAFYSKGRDYLETAVRLLFQQFQPAGAAPVSIPALGPLNLSPDPNQTIQLDPTHWIDTSGSRVPLEETEEPLTTLDLKRGEGIIFRTSVIVDRNGNPVPDGTAVDFFRYYPRENLTLEPITARTSNGVAQIEIFKELDSPLQVRVVSDLASQSVPFNIGPGIVDTPTPTVTPTPFPTDTPTPTDVPTPTETPTPEPLPSPEPSPTAVLTGVTPARPGQPVSFIDLLYSLMMIIIVGGVAFTLGGDRFALEERVRPALVAVAFGLLGYIAFTIVGMVFFDSNYIGPIVERNNRGHWIAPLISFLFAVAGVAAWFLKPGRLMVLTPPEISSRQRSEET